MKKQISNKGDDKAIIEECIKRMAVVYANDPHFEELWELVQEIIDELGYEDSIIRGSMPRWISEDYVAELATVLEQVETGDLTEYSEMYLRFHEAEKRKNKFILIINEDLNNE